MNLNQMASGSVPFDRRFIKVCLPAFLVSVAIQIISYDPLINPYDEGIILTGAESVYRGALPYKDFWTMYAPGQYYLASWLFHVFGTSDIVVRGIGIIAKGIISSLSCYSALLLTNRTYARITFVVVLAILIGFRQDSFPVFPAMALSMAAMLLIERGIYADPRLLLLGGICTGIATCFRHDLGAYGFVSSSIAILLTYKAELRPLSSLNVRNPWRCILKDVFIYGVGISLVTIPVAAYFLYSVPLPDLYENLILIPSTVYPAFRSIPWPGLPELGKALYSPGKLSAFSVYVPFLVCTWVLVSEIRRPPNPEKEGGFPHEYVPSGRFLASLMAITGLLFTMKGVVRVTPLHMSQSLVLSVVLIARIVHGYGGMSFPGRVVLVPFLVVSAITVGFLAWTGVSTAAKDAYSLFSGKDSPIVRFGNPSLARIRGTDTDADYRNAATFILEHTNDNDYIYVGAGRHDKIFINDISFYFVVGRRPVTKWYELDPGIQTTDDIQRIMVYEMETKRPKYLILDSRWDNMREPNNSMFSSGVYFLDGYIAESFTEEKRFGTVRILGRRL